MKDRSVLSERTLHISEHDCFITAALWFRTLRKFEAAEEAEYNQQVGALGGGGGVLHVH